MNYRCFDIASKFLELAEKDGKPLTQMKLLKLTYIAHGFYLAVNSKPLIKEYVEAWEYGPVIPELYYVIKRFGKRAVQREVVDLYAEDFLDGEDEEFVELIWDIYKNNSGVELSSMTHQANTPWDKTVRKDRGWGGYIDNGLIKKYYDKKLQA